MDFEAGLPILVASLVAVLLLTWLSIQRRWIERSIRHYNNKQMCGVTAPLERTNARVRWVVISSTLAAPMVMAFSGQLDAHGVANVFNGALQVIAPFTSACFSAAVAWLLIASALVVHATHCRLLDLFRYPRERREFW